MASGMIDSSDSLYRKMCYLRSHAQDMRHLAPIGVSWLHPADSSDKKLRKRPTAFYQSFRVGGDSMHEPGSPTRVSVTSEAMRLLLLIPSIASTYALLG